MQVRLFVTCGRGLDAFVKEEINEKIPNVCDVHSLGEGKVAFAIETSELQVINEISQAQFLVELEEAMSELCENNSTRLEAIQQLYNLKLIERLFLMIHSEEVKSNDIDENKVMTILKNTNLDSVANLVLALKRYQEKIIEDQVLCCSPESCPGLMNQRKAKEEISQKRMAAFSTRKMLVGCKEREICMKRAKSYDPSDNETLVSRKKKVRGADIVNYSQTENSLNNCNKEYINSSIKDEVIQSQSVFRNIQLQSSNSKISYENSSEMTKQRSKMSPPDVMNIDEDDIKNNEQSELNVSENVPKINHKNQKQNYKKDSSVSFRVTCRITGKYKKILSTDSLTKHFKKTVEYIKTEWLADWESPLLDFYVNITDLHFILGVTLSKESLSLRHYIPHITLRSTTSYLMAKLCCLSPGDFLLDPMCGGGTILAEAAKCFKVGQVIGGDISEEQLEVARCNLCGLETPYSLILGQATRIPLKDDSVSAVVCDLPFGQKHKLTTDSKVLLQGITRECYRLLVNGGRAVFLLSSQQHDLLSQIASKKLNSVPINNDSEVQMKLESTYPLSLGRTMAYVVVLVKDVSGSDADRTAINQSCLPVDKESFTEDAGIR